MSAQKLRKMCLGQLSQRSIRSFLSFSPSLLCFCLPFSMSSCLPMNRSLFLFSMSLSLYLPVSIFPSLHNFVTSAFPTPHSLSLSTSLSFSNLLLFLFFDPLFPFRFQRPLKHLSFHLLSPHLTFFYLPLYFLFYLLFTFVLFSYLLSLMVFYSHLPCLALSLSLSFKTTNYLKWTSTNISFPFFIK